MATRTKKRRERSATDELPFETDRAIVRPTPAPRVGFSHTKRPSPVDQNAGETKPDLGETAGGASKETASEAADRATEETAGNAAREAVGTYRISTPQSHPALIKRENELGREPQNEPENDPPELTPKRPNRRSRPSLNRVAPPRHRPETPPLGPNLHFGVNPFDPYEAAVDGENSRPSETVGGTSRNQLRDEVQQWCPPVPGVYGMFDRLGELIYVGKSRSLRNRLMSYFGDSARGEKAGRIIKNARVIRWETQPSDFAAQLRELDLIRRHIPRFNVQGVPQRQRPVYLCLGRKPAETFFLAASPPKTNCIAVEGPFYGAARMDRVVEALNKTFGLRDCSQKTVFQFSDQLSLFDTQPRPGCLRLEIGTCLGPCAAACSRDEYLTRVNAAQSFLEGFNDEPIVATTEIMENAAANRQYELAARARDTLKSLNYALRKLTHLADARNQYSFIYAATGYDGRSVWYLIRRGEIAAVAPAPADADDYRKLKPMLKSWATRLSGFQGGVASEHPHTVSIVASWFRKYPGELKQTFAPESAGRKYRHLSRV